MCTPGYYTNLNILCDAGSEMSQPANLRLILSDHNVQKLALPFGIPGRVEELHSIVQVWDSLGFLSTFQGS